MGDSKTRIQTQYVDIPSRTLQVHTFYCANTDFILQILSGSIKKTTDIIPCLMDLSRSLFSWLSFSRLFII